MFISKNGEISDTRSAGSRYFERQTRYRVVALIPLASKLELLDYFRQMNIVDGLMQLSTL